MPLQKRLTPKQTKALDALLDGKSQQAAADAAGVNRKTIMRWVSEPLFWDTLNSHSQKAVHIATRRLSSTLDMSVDIMREVMEDTSAPAGVRLRAARYAADCALRLLEVSDILLRLEELEAKVIGGESKY